MSPRAALLFQVYQVAPAPVQVSGPARVSRFGSPLRI